ncbi:S8 family serine peptidase [Actinopolymorpha alba]|uniref:S8 family serine peptidase n=1 Tax=Actinopolymorpha alba TaxID=533267 RepID=UPI0003708E1C|nr:S8 family serine peptidase [Actinopolymorpha alba]
MSRARRHLRALGIGGLVAGLVLAIGPAGWAGPATPTNPGGPGNAAAPGTPEQAGHRAQRSLTLVTGDRVTLPSADAATGTVVPGKGREGMRFLTRRAEGRTYVFPSDALPLLRRGILDRRLFDVTGLIRAGYDDAGRKVVPLIVTYTGASARERGQAGLTQRGGRTVRALAAVNGTAVEVDKKQASSFWNTLAPQRGSARALGTGIRKVWLDGVRHPVLDESVPQIGAPEAWKAGFTGKGVTVAVLDTGIDATHPDLAGQVVGARNFTEERPGDGFGHGTHVASTIAGTAKASNGRYKGVAPDAKLLDGKVCDSGGGCTDSAILAGMEWAAVEKRARVVNLSLGGQDTADLDPMEEAVNNLTKKTGTLFVIAAGNAGPGARTVSSPGTADAALTVGAVDKKDQLADFSGQGPRLGDAAVKPDITAPGVDITAARAKGTEMGDPVGERYVTASGTSMATPHVVGAAALLAQQNPGWKAGQLKSTLMASARPHAKLTAFQQGAGRADVARAIRQTVTSSPASVSFGLQQWPHADDRPVTKPLTYRNTSGAPVKLTLTATMTGPNGKPAPAGALSLSATELVVPAGGTASVSVTSNTRHNGADGLYSGRVTATAGAVTVTTPLGVEKEVESYNVTVKHLDRRGKSSDAVFDMLYGIDVNAWEFPVTVDGVTKLRLPKGEYLLESDFMDENEESATILVQPRLMVTKDVTVVADARTADPVRTTVQRRSAQPALVDLGYDRRSVDGGLSSSFLLLNFDGVYAGHLGPRVSTKDMTSRLGSQWAEPGPKEDFENSPYFYGLLDTEKGRFFTGFQRSVKDRELAKLSSKFARQLPGRKGNRVMFATSPEGTGGWSTGLALALPRTVTSYLEVRGVAWSTLFSEFVLDEEGWPSDQTQLSSTERTYRAGRAYKEQWNAAAFGTAFPRSGYSWADRSGDVIFASIPVFSDGAGHAGYSLTDKASTTLYRDGRKVASSESPGLVEDVKVPAAKGTFRLETSATRPSYSPFSTRVEAAWTFRSGHVRGEEPEPLPLSAIRFSPRLDQDNRNHDGRIAVVPVTIERQAGSKAGHAASLTVEVSVDDGKSWQEAPAFPAGHGSWLALVVTPKSGAKYVSLRAKATDTKGNTAEQTIIRAYAVASDSGAAAR